MAGLPGDLYLHLRVRPDTACSAVTAWTCAADLHVTMAQAALGAQLTVETLDGPQEIAVPPGTPTGQELRFRGQGVPHLQRRGRGDLVMSRRGRDPDRAHRGPGGPVAPVWPPRGRGGCAARRGPHGPPALRLRLIAPALQTQTAGGRGGDGDPTPASVGAAAQVFVDDLERPATAADDAHHLARVLRLRTGETGGGGATARVDGGCAGTPGRRSAPGSPDARTRRPVRCPRPGRPGDNRRSSP